MIITNECKALQNMKPLYFKFFNLLFIFSLLFSFTSNSQNTSVSTKNIMETINASGSNASGSSGSATYSIGQVFYTYISESVYNVAQGIQHKQVHPESIAGTFSENQMICS